MTPRAVGAALIAIAIAAALSAPFVAPHAADARDRSLLNAPPTLPRIVADDGSWHAPFIYPWVVANRLDVRPDGELVPAAAWELKGRPTQRAFVRTAADNTPRIGCVLDGNRLVWLDPAAPEKPAWEHVATSKIIGRPQLVESVLVLALQQGVLGQGDGLGGVGQGVGVGDHAGDHVLVRGGDAGAGGIVDVEVRDDVQPRFETGRPG